MARLRITKGEKGEDVWPILWQDNYLTLLPGEDRHVIATYEAKLLNGTKPFLVVELWNNILHGN